VSAADRSCRVSLVGLEVFGRHGALPAERELGQRFIVDVAMDLPDCPAVASDDLAETVDYDGLSQAVAEIVSGPPVALLERLAELIAVRVLEEALVGAVEVTVRKPHVALARPLREASVSIRRERP
jgi:7,8-dihydroneopterin aldolase/epimerase/oxygenase